MVESANKNVVEARLKGPGMDWERKNVNPLLVLRNAICNDRWQEMWQKALNSHRKLQALQRSARAEQRAQVLLAVGNSTSVESPSQSAAASQEISPPVLVATPPRSSRPSTGRKRHNARNRVNSSHHGSGEVSRDT